MDILANFLVGTDKLLAEALLLDRSPLVSHGHRVGERWGIFGLLVPSRISSYRSSFVALPIISCVVRTH